LVKDEGNRIFAGQAITCPQKSLVDKINRAIFSACGYS
jgi:hypothetical protein